MFTRSVSAGATLLVLWGCGGGGGTGRTGTGRLLNYGAVSSAVAKSVADKMGSGSFSKGQTVGRGDVVVVDGDATSSDTLKTDEEIDRVLASGASVLLVDAKEAHKESMRGAKRAGGSVGDDSHGVLFSPFTLPSGARSVHILELAAGERKITTKRVVQRKTGLVKGNGTTKTVTRKPTAVSLAKFAQRVGELKDTPWVDPVASQIPAEVSWMSVPYEVIESSDDAALNGEAISEDITFVFRGFSSPPAGNGWYANCVIIDHQGTVTMGSPTVNTVTNTGQGFLEALFGWFQTTTSISITPDRSNPSGQQMGQGTTVGMTVNGETYQGTPDGFILYYDSSNNTQIWSPSWNVPADPLTVPGWTLGLSSFSDPVFNYYQTSPFDTSQNPVNYSSGLDNNSIGQFLPLPTASTSTLTLAGTSSFASNSLIDGPVRFNLNIGRVYTELTTEFETNPNITLGAGGTTLEDVGNRAFVIELNLCKPGGGTQP